MPPAPAADGPLTTLPAAAAPAARRASARAAAAAAGAADTAADTADPRTAGGKPRPQVALGLTADEVTGRRGARYPPGALLDVNTK